MGIRVVRLGTPRAAGEGTRVGTVRRPPRGVPKDRFASGNWYDVWFPNLAPSVETMKLGQAVESQADWAKFARRYRAEMARPDNTHAIALLAALSHRADFSVGCYCENEARCHRRFCANCSRNKARV
jgi:uncharacterized protein YeaO (DUF488 family)